MAMQLKRLQAQERRARRKARAGKVTMAREDFMDIFHNARKDEAREWISQILHVKFDSDDDFKEKLKDGSLLCQLYSTIDEASNIRYKSNPKTSAGCLENISFFIDACRKYGVLADLSALDLYEDKNFKSVVAFIHDLAAVAEKKGFSAMIGRESSVLQKIEAEANDNDARTDQQRSHSRKTTMTLQMPEEAWSVIRRRTTHPEPVDNSAEKHRAETADSRVLSKYNTQVEVEPIEAPPQDQGSDSGGDSDDDDMFQLILVDTEASEECITKFVDNGESTLHAEEQVSEENISVNTDSEVAAHTTPSEAVRASPEIKHDEEKSEYHILEEDDTNVSDISTSCSEIEEEEDDEEILLRSMSNLSTAVSDCTTCSTLSSNDELVELLEDTNMSDATTSCSSICSDQDEMIVTKPAFVPDVEEERDVNEHDVREHAISLHTTVDELDSTTSNAPEPTNSPRKVFKDKDENDVSRVLSPSRRKHKKRSKSKKEKSHQDEGDSEKTTKGKSRLISPRRVRNEDSITSPRRRKKKEKEASKKRKEGFTSPLGKKGSNHGALEDPGATRPESVISPRRRRKEKEKETRKKEKEKAEKEEHESGGHKQAATDVVQRPQEDEILDEGSPRHNMLAGGSLVTKETENSEQESELSSDSNNGTFQKRPDPVPVVKPKLGGTGMKWRRSLHPQLRHSLSVTGETGGGELSMLSKQTSVSPSLTASASSLPVTNVLDRASSSLVSNSRPSLNDSLDDLVVDRSQLMSVPIRMVTADHAAKKVARSRRLSFFSQHRTANTSDDVAELDEDNAPAAPFSAPTTRRNKKGGHSHVPGAEGRATGGKGKRAETSAIAPEDLRKLKRFENLHQKSQRQRLAVLYEITNTERAYIQDLKFIADVREVLVSSSVITSQEDTVLFANVLQLIPLHQDILDQVVSRMDKAKDDECWSVSIADVFIKMSSFLKMYTTYVTNSLEQGRCVEAMVKDRPQFLEVICNFPMQHCSWIPSNVKHLLLASLIKPFQRVLKYPLLIKEILKFTSDDHPDFGKLLDAEGKISEVAEFLNERKRFKENQVKLMEIQSKIHGQPSSFQLVDPLRRFVREGSIVKISKGKAQERYFFLFSDMLLWCARNIITKRNEYKGSVFLNTLLVNDRPNRAGPNRIYEFELVRVDHKKKKYILCFDVEAEKQEWMNVISQLVSDFLRQEGMARASKGVNKETALLQVRDISRKLEDLNEIYSAGSITQDEFEQREAKLEDLLRKAKLVMGTDLDAQAAFSPPSERRKEGNIVGPLSGSSKNASDGKRDDTGDEEKQKRRKKKGKREDGYADAPQCDCEESNEQGSRSIMVIGESAGTDDGLDDEEAERKKQKRREQKERRKKKEKKDSLIPNKNVLEDVVVSDEVGTEDGRG